MTRHHEWISSFWCNVAATVLGIVLTFGVSEWLDRQEERQNAETLVERSFKNLDIRLADLDKAIQTMNEQDSLLIICRKALPDNLDSIPTTVFTDLIYTLGTRHHFIQSTAIETGFQQDINSQKILGDFADVLSDAFEGINRAERLNDKINEQKVQFVRIGTKYWLMNTNSINRAQSIEILTNPEVLYIINITSTEAQLMRRISRYMHNYIKQAHALWDKEITYEEFERTAIKETI